MARKGGYYENDQSLYKPMNDCDLCGTRYYGRTRMVNGHPVCKDCYKDWRDGRV